MCLFAGTSVPTGLTFSSVRTNTNVIAVTVAENVAYTLFNGVVTFIGKLTAGLTVWPVVTNGSNTSTSLLAYSWGNNNGINPNNANTLTGYLIST
jgi:hypothetical protein